MHQVHWKEVDAEVGQVLVQNHDQSVSPSLEPLLALM
jgi:hypothetical protein